MYCTCTTVGGYQCGSFFLGLDRSDLKAIDHFDMGQNHHLPTFDQYDELVHLFLFLNDVLLYIFFMNLNIPTLGLYPKYVESEKEPKKPQLPIPTDH